jgi:hypothetical protein
MRKIAILSVLGLLALAIPAQATDYTPAPSPPHGPKPHKPKPHKPKPHTPKAPHKCLPHSVGYNASGTLVSAALTPAGKGRYSGTVEVTVTKANHHAPTGAQTLTLASARVKFHHGVDSTAPASGSRVKLHGKITQLSKHCPQEGFTPAITVKKIDIHQPAKQPKS